MTLKVAKTVGVPPQARWPISRHPCWEEAYPVAAGGGGGGGRGGGGAYAPGRRSRGGAVRM